MALSRRTNNRFSASIWPGFVDAMTALMLVLFFVLSIFMIVQFVLRDTISGQGRELDELSVQVANLADALGLERSRADQQQALVSTLTAERDAAAAEALEFESQVAGLIARNTDLVEQLTTAQAESEEALSANQALELALAQAREEIDAGVEAARLAAARREALEALVTSLESERETLAADREALEAAQADLEQTVSQLDEAEAARLAEAAAAEALRERLENADAELTAMTLSLEEERQRAEETLTLLAAAVAAKEQLESQEFEALSEAEKRAAELAQARALLAEEQEVSLEAQRQVALLNQQTAELRNQLDSIQALLDDARARDIQAKVQIESLGQNLNAALARVAVEERKRAELEARERERLEAEAEGLQAEARNLENYRSEFFGRMRQILGDREGVRVVGDRFVFASEVLFAPGSSILGASGQEQVGRVADVILEIADEIPPQINWILRVDGHTDKEPVGTGSRYADNWELSQARALSVVRYMINSRGVPSDRLAAAGFGEFQPVDPGDTPAALARNRRIELKFTER